MVMLGLALTGCDSGATSSLASVALSAAPPGYSAQPVGDNGALSVDDASSASPADPTSVRNFLNNSTFQGGFERVWTHGDDFITDLIYQFGDGATAVRFMTLETEQIKSFKGDYTYPAPQLGNGQGFVLYSTTRSGDKSVFCNGVWFTVSNRAFQLLDCSVNPGGATRVLELAAQQYQQAGGSPAPSPIAS